MTDMTRDDFIKFLKKPAHDGFVIDDDEVLEMSLRLVDEGLVSDVDGRGPASK